MVFSREAFLFTISLSASLLQAEAFCFISNVYTLSKRSHKTIRPSIGFECRFSPLPVTLSSVSDLVGSDDDDDEQPEEYILSVGDLESSGVAADSEEVSPTFAHQQRLQDARIQNRRHETDTGSPEYQVAGMTERIAYLTDHLKTHPKDFSTRRGLVALVNKRRRLLNFLSIEDVGRYKELIASLGIRHKAVGLVPTKEEKYGNFPSQKIPKKHGPNKKSK
eukprot:CAMPEP_0172437582 /NCGR_PEP_ID=MMETSP1064-20121228/72336_1 /TAXON_ID=202472 /ORGANISM="Aulacoseira subarctica , Strain CCAP 1002/5" /LENGTH=220 /DNA_ID=CAMNT_0013186065 /DNA_START=587 /DNA_END=1249 /DNA_ORIENTATION=-